MKKLILFIAFGASICFGQDLTFTQFHQAAFTNPAMSTLSSGRCLNTISRVRWLGKSTGSIANLINYEDYVSPFGAMGVYYLNDYALNGMYLENQFGFTYSYRFNFSRKISGALGTTLVLGDRDYRETTAFPTVINPRTNRSYFEEANDIEGYYLDARTGLVMYSKHFYLDVAFTHFTGIKTVSEMNVAANLGFSFAVGGKESHPHYIMPSINYVNQGNYNSLAMNISYSKSGVFMGFKLAFQESIGGLAGVRLPFIEAVYSFEYIQSKKIMQQDFQGFGHELSLRFDFRKNVSSGRKLSSFYQTHY